MPSATAPDENVQQIKAGGYCIEAFRVNHNVTCYGYTLSVRRSGRFLPEKAQENRVPKEFWSRLQKGAVIEHDGRTYTKELILGPERRGSSPFGPIRVKGSLRSALPMDKSSPGSPLIWSPW